MGNIINGTQQSENVESSRPTITVGHRYEGCQVQGSIYNGGRVKLHADGHDIDVGATNEDAGYIYNDSKVTQTLHVHVYNGLQNADFNNFKNPVDSVNPVDSEDPFPVTSVNPEIDKLCVICLCGTKNWVLQPCYHAKFCKECIERIMASPTDRKKCPVCRAPIESHRRIFIW